MTGKVIQGSFLGGQPKLATVQPRVAQPPIQAKTAPRPPGPPATIFAVRSPGPPMPAFAGRPPAPSSAGKQGTVQRHGAGGAFAVDTGSLGLASSGGRPLPDAVRGQMEAALGADFSTVRVHVGPQAERIGAIAFTVGSDIYFAPSRYQPDTIQGRQLLGHELAHVVQQRAGRVRNPLGGGLAVVQDRALEAEADRLGQRAAMHRIVAQPKPRPGLHGRTPVGHQSAALAHTGFRAGHGAPRWTGAARIQRYEIVNWDGATDEFLAQEEELGATKDNPRAFLEAADKAWITPAKAGVQLRVSDDGKMAIEHSNLSQRQAKCFFATKDVIGNSNRTLQGKVRLAMTGETIEVVYEGRPVTLFQVVPGAADGSDEPSGIESPEDRRRRIAAIQFSQNCNDIAQQISGLRADLASSNLALAKVLELTGTDPDEYNADDVRAQSENRAMVELRVAADDRVVVAKAEYDEIYSRLGDLEDSLDAAKNSTWGWMKAGGVSEWVGWGNAYTQTVNRLAIAIKQVRSDMEYMDAVQSKRDIYNKRVNKARKLINRSETVKKISQSPIWDLAERYVQLISSEDGPGMLRQAGINQSADAQQPGDVYQIRHLATSKKLLRPELALYDFASGKKMRTNWDWHFATVVAVSGADRVTLENFARGDLRGPAPDPRWYFQMYGSRPGQSFHEQAAAEYANPLTVVHRRQ